MRYRLLGRTGLRVSEAFLGTLGFGVDDGGAGPDECHRILDGFVEAGGNVIDTASSYGDGRSEEIIGSWLDARRPVRDRLVLATKYSWTRDGTNPNASGNHRKNLRLSLEESLRRLRTDYVDLLWVHVWDRHTPVEETMRALDDVVRAGQALYIGISDAPAWVAARANEVADRHGWSPFAAVQVPYNLLWRDAEREVLPMAEALGLTVATWGPLAHGVLSGIHTRPGATSLDQLDERQRAAAVAVQAVADDLGATPAQVAVAWTRARSRAVHPLVGPLTAGQLRENLGFLDLTLPDDARRRLDGATGFTRGYPEDFLTDCVPWVFGEVAASVEGR